MPAGQRQMNSRISGMKAEPIITPMIGIATRRKRRSASMASVATVTISVAANAPRSHGSGNLRR